MNRHFTKEVSQMTNKHMKRSSKPLVIMDANQNHNNIPLPIHQDDFYFKTKATKQSVNKDGDTEILVHC
jgi:hypothetical protein